MVRCTSWIEPYQGGTLGCTLCGGVKNFIYMLEVGNLVASGSMSLWDYTKTRQIALVDETWS